MDIQKYIEIEEIFNILINFYKISISFVSLEYKIYLCETNV